MVDSLLKEMAQVLKDDVSQRIVAAALVLFAEGGYMGTAMGDVAARAEVSAGNIYRYFATKAALFEAAVPMVFARRLRGLVKTRVEALHGEPSVTTLSIDHRWRAAAEELVRESVAQRLRVVVLLSDRKTEGTELAGYSQRMVDELVLLALAWAKSVGVRRVLDARAKRTLTRIYRDFLATMASILETHDNERAIREAVSDYQAYHLAGMRGFLQ